MPAAQEPQGAGCYDISETLCPLIDGEKRVIFLAPRDKDPLSLLKPEGALTTPASEDIRNSSHP